MLRCLPGELDPGAPPVFGAPADVIAWVRGVDWLVDEEHAAVLHLDDQRQLTCVGATQSPLKYLSPRATDSLANDALECASCAAVMAVDVRPKLSPSAPSAVDVRRHRKLRGELAIHAVALLDTLIVTGAGGVSVTGVAEYPCVAGMPWLQIHTPERGVRWANWSHLGAGSLVRPPSGRPQEDRVLSLLSDPAGDDERGEP